METFDNQEASVAVGSEVTGNQLADVYGDQLVYITDSQELGALRWDLPASMGAQFGIEPRDVTAAFVVVGDYDMIAVTDSSRPYAASTRFIVVR